jgi:hypothetical protein
MAVGRRDLLRWVGAVGAARGLPACSKELPKPLPSSGFFTDDERKALGALANAIIPPDDASPGGEALGAVDYIEGLLTAFDSDPPRIFAGGPYSGRAPFGDSHGGRSDKFPPDDFDAFVPLDRLNERAWRIRLYGSDASPGSAPNGAKITGLRDRLKQGLADAMSASDKPLADLDPSALADALNGLNAAFRSTLVELVCEGAFGAPEYGGNKMGAGWTLTHYEGDQQPLGYSLFDESGGQYKERPDAPMSTPNPGADPEPMDADVTALIDEVIAALGGKKFV